MALALTLGAACVAGPAGARTLRVPAADTLARAALAIAQPGDTLVLAAGIHRGPLRITRPLVLRGERGAVVDGGGIGTVIEVGATGVRIEGLTVRASGRQVLTIDSGIHVLATGVMLRDLTLVDVLYGIYGERADDLVVERCALRGRVDPLDESGDGNGIHLWYSRNLSVKQCDVTRFLDGIYLSFADQVRVEDTRLHDQGRYGLHTMYCQQNTFVRDTLTRNAAGCAIMFSNHLEVGWNAIVHNRGPRTYGLLLRDCSDGRFHDNQLVDNTVAVFMDGSNRNRFEDNLVQDDGWGLLMFSSCADNVVTGNDFIHDDYPVALDMRFTRNAFDDGRRGNFWSDAIPYDLDGDGVSDVPFSPVTAFSFVSKQYPDLAVLSASPAVAALGVAERVFPAMRPSEAVDRFPRVRPGRAGVRRAPLAPEPRAWGMAGGFAVMLVGGLALAAGRRSA
ncbi:MAG: nitrous oxide reductase family maturation protein NosD [Candidatus Eisenbacteria bacterium]